MKLICANDLLNLLPGAAVEKRNLYDLIQYSKVEGSKHWAGTEGVIGNTPQQGINWIGQFPALTAVIIKVRPGAYLEDGWIDSRQSYFKYSFKSRHGRISYTEKANRALINQPLFNYPILLFTEFGQTWQLGGAFQLCEIASLFVTLARFGTNAAAASGHLISNDTFEEGNKNYVIHLLAERNRHVVRLAKQRGDWKCEICQLRFSDRYGVQYIEAHHKKPLSRYTTRTNIDERDLALLCANCHRAVHALMNKCNDSYESIRQSLICQIKKTG